VQRDGEIEDFGMGGKTESGWLGGGDVVCVGVEVFYQEANGVVVVISEVEECGALGIVRLVCGEMGRDYFDVFDHTFEDGGLRTDYDFMGFPSSIAVDDSQIGEFACHEGSMMVSMCLSNA